MQDGTDEVGELEVERGEGQPDEVEPDAGDPELDALESDLETVQSALDALDADDLDRAEELAARLTDEVGASTDPVAD